jgi:hypothetical protein
LLIVADCKIHLDFQWASHWICKSDRKDLGARKTVKTIISTEVITISMNRKGILEERIQQGEEKVKVLKL